MVKDFVYGTDAQYKLLRRKLEDGRCHIYPCCRYPSCCSRSSGRIGFEKEGNTYALHIDKGMNCQSGAPRLFRQWIENGTLRFLEFNDLKVFLRSLRGII